MLMPEIGGKKRNHHIKPCKTVEWRRRWGHLRWQLCQTVKHSRQHISGKGVSEHQR